MQFRRIAKSAPAHTAGIAGAVTFVAGSKLLDAIDQCSLMTQSGHAATGHNRPEWPGRALLMANVDRSEFDAEIATTASRANEILDKAP